jgi:predicted NAD/FAD-dependent oxidoreductase
MVSPQLNCHNQLMTIARYPFAIIGSGIAGITLGRLLDPATCLLLEKSRGLGGRLAGRRLGAVTFNHGAREFVATHPWLQQQARAGIDSGLLGLVADKFIPVGSINSWVKELGRDLLIWRECQIERIERDTSGYYNLFDSAAVLRCQAQRVVLAVPAPQADKILKNSGLQLPALEQVIYQSMLEIMATSLEPLPVPQIPALSFTAIPMPENYYHFESVIEPDFDQQQLRSQLQQCHPEAELHLHQWRYGRVTQPISSQHQLSLAQQNIFLMGDYFFGSDINAAVASAHYLYHFLRSTRYENSFDRGQWPHRTGTG